MNKFSLTLTPAHNEEFYLVLVEDNYGAVTKSEKAHANHTFIKEYYDVSYIIIRLLKEHIIARSPDWKKLLEIISKISIIQLQTFVAQLKENKLRCHIFNFGLFYSPLSNCA